MKDLQLVQSTNYKSASYKRPVSEEELNTRDFKKIKVFLVRAIKVDNISKLDTIKIGFTAIILKEGDIEINVLIPTLYEVAINDKIYSHKWRIAIQEELKALEINSTQREEVLPSGTNLVSTKWVFIVKVKSDGTLDRFKARLVTRGFSQIYGIDYFETFARTVRMDTLRVFLAIAAKKNWDLTHMDVKNAFTESPLKEKIYLLPPKGVKVRKGYILHVLQSLYRLK